MPKRPKLRWQFLYRNADDMSDKAWQERTYAGTLLQACTKMVAFSERQAFEVEIDYEARACHVRRYSSRKHEETFPNLTYLDHPIKDLGS